MEPMDARVGRLDATTCENNQRTSSDYPIVNTKVISGAGRLLIDFVVFARSQRDRGALIPRPR
jgi:hypothetical protein